jgi:hypothetical protein
LGDDVEQHMPSAPNHGESLSLGVCVRQPDSRSGRVDGVDWHAVPVSGGSDGSLCSQPARAVEREETNCLPACQWESKVVMYIVGGEV